MISRHKIGIGGALALMVLIGVGVYVAGRGPTEDNTMSQYQDSQTGVVVRYPSVVTAQPLSEEDKENDIILRLAEEQGQPPILITVRYESGLKSVATLTKSSIIDMLMSNSEKALPQRFKGFRRENSRRYDHNGRHAGEIVFTYDSPIPGERIKQRFVIVVKDDDTAVYLAMQSKEKDFDQENNNLFAAIAGSLDSR